jgi:hypothetical protein
MRAPAAMRRSTLASRPRDGRGAVDREVQGFLATRQLDHLEQAQPARRMSVVHRAPLDDVLLVVDQVEDQGPLRAGAGLLVPAPRLDHESRGSRPGQLVRAPEQVEQHVMPRVMEDEVVGALEQRHQALHRAAHGRVGALLAVERARQVGHQVAACRHGEDRSRTGGARWCKVPTAAWTPSLSRGW